jgi:hypothetical protein
MNAILKPVLTDAELSRALDRALEEKRKEWSFFTESVTEADNFLGTMLHRASIERDWIRFGEVMEQLDRQYFKDCGFDEEAENDLLGSMDVNGKRHLEA